MSGNFSFLPSTPPASGRPRTRRGHLSADNESVATASPSNTLSFLPQEDSTTPEGSPIRGAYIETPGNQTLSPSLVPKSESGIFSKDSHISSRRRAGTTMEQLEEEDASSSEDNFPDMSRSMLSQTSLSGSTKQPYNQAPILGSTMKSSLVQRPGHRRNKTTISNISEVLPPNPQTPSLMEAMEQFGWKDSTASYQKKAQTFDIKRGPGSPSILSRAVEPEPGHPGYTAPPTVEPMNSPAPIRWQESTPKEEVNPDTDLTRTLSGISIDSESTVADDTWNPVDAYLGSSSPEEAIKTNQAVPLYGLNNQAAVLGLWEEVRENPEAVPAEQLDFCYPLDEHEMAGHRHGVEVTDFAYATGRAPCSEEEWENVELVPRHQRTADEVSLADTIEVSDGEVVDQRALDLARRETYHGDDREETVFLNSALTEAEGHFDVEDHEFLDARPSNGFDEFLLPSTADVPPEVEGLSPNSEEHTEVQERASFQGDKSLLPSTEYVQPAAQLIAEDAGSIMDYTSTSGSDGDDEMSVPLTLTPLTRVENNATNADVGEINAIDKIPVSSADRETITPTRLQKTREPGSEKQRRHSTNVFQNISARLPHWRGSSRDPKKKYKLDHSLQSPSQGGPSQRVVSEPLLGGGVNVPVQHRKRHSSIARLVNKIKGSEGSKKAYSDSAPRESLLRRLFGRADDLIARHKL